MGSKGLQGVTLLGEGDERTSRLFAISQIEVEYIVYFSQTAADVAISDKSAIRTTRINFPHASADFLKRMSQKLSCPTTKSLEACLKVIRNIADFAIVFADRKGLRLRFYQPVTYDLASQIEREVLSINPEAADVCDPVQVADHIVKLQEVQFWWD